LRVERIKHPHLLMVCDRQVQRIAGAQPRPVARTGDLAQNVDFAIRGEFVRDFLQANRVGINFSTGSAVLPNTEIASQGAVVTVRVRCLREAAPAPAPASKQP
jgi:hypothetical protein